MISILIKISYLPLIIIHNFDSWDYFKNFYHYLQMIIINSYIMINLMFIGDYKIKHLNFENIE